MTKAETKAHWAIPDETLGDGYTLTHKREREAYVKGYHQAIEDACEWLKQQQEMLEYCFSDAGDFADLLKQAMEE